MAAVPVTLDGVLYDLHNKTTQRVVLIADASLSGLGVGGGPIAPPPGGGGTPQPPDHIWGGGNVPMPTPPIANVPGAPGYQPPGGGGQPPGKPPLPVFPIWGPPGIDFPDKPGYPPVVGGGPIIPPDKPPSGGAWVPGWEAKAYWTPENGWAVAIVPKDETNVPTPSA